MDDPEVVAAIAAGELDGSPPVVATATVLQGASPSPSPSLSASPSPSSTSTPTPTPTHGDDVITAAVKANP